MFRLTRLARSPLPHALFALALLVRGMAVPGYMSGGDGWPVQLCPEGLAPSSVTLLFGVDDAQHSHHHGHHDAGGDGDSNPAENGPGSSADRCALGGSTAPAVLAAGPAELPAPADLLVNTGTTRPGAVRDPVTAFQARAPPLLLPSD